MTRRATSCHVILRARRCRGISPRHRLERREPPSSPRHPMSNRQHRRPRSEAQLNEAREARETALGGRLMAINAAICGAAYRTRAGKRPEHDNSAVTCAIVTCRHSGRAPLGGLPREGGEIMPINRELAGRRAKCRLTKRRHRRRNNPRANPGRKSSQAGMKFATRGIEHRANRRPPIRRDIRAFAEPCGNETAV